MVLNELSIASCVRKKIEKKSILYDSNFRVILPLTNNYKKKKIQNVQIKKKINYVVI